MPEQNMRAGRSVLGRDVPDSAALKFALSNVNAAFRDWSRRRRCPDFDDVLLKLRAACKHPAIIARGAQNKSSKAGGKTWHDCIPPHDKRYIKAGDQSSCSLPDKTSCREARSLLRRGDPGVDLFLKHGQRQCAGVQNLIVEFAHVEFLAKFLLRLVFQTQDGEGADFIGQCL